MTFSCTEGCPFLSYKGLLIFTYCALVLGFGKRKGHNKKEDTNITRSPHENNSPQGKRRWEGSLVEQKKGKTSHNDKTSKGIKVKEQRLTDICLSPHSGE